MRAVAVAAALAIFGSALNSLVSAAARDVPPAPRGWDSYDSNPIWGNVSITEEQVLAQARALAEYRAADGRPLYPTVVIDEGWAESQAYGWTLDEYARPVPNPVMFPSAFGGLGFGPLAEELNGLGLSLGLWMIKGIPQLAVDMNLSIYGTPYTARDIALQDKACSWHKDVLWVNASHPGAQAYYSSMAELYAGWGVSYIKLDCIFGNDLDMPEIELAHRAYQQLTGTLSLSPGTGVTPALAKTVVGYADLYRASNDLWDCFTVNNDDVSCLGGTSVLKNTLKMVDLSKAGLLAAALPTAEPFSGSIPSPVSYPDFDMLAFGQIALPLPHVSHYTPANMRYVYGLWSITQSPIVLGGDVRTYEAAGIQQMLNSSMAMAAQQTTNIPQLLVADVPPFVNSSTSRWASGVTMWQVADRDIVGAFFLGVFPMAVDPSTLTTANATKAWNVPVEWPGDTAEFPEFSVFDCFTERLVRTIRNGDAVSFDVSYNDGVLFYLQPRSV